MSNHNTLSTANALPDHKITCALESENEFGKDWESLIARFEMVDPELLVSLATYLRESSRKILEVDAKYILLPETLGLYDILFRKFLLSQLKIVWVDFTKHQINL